MNVYRLKASNIYRWAAFAIFASLSVTYYYLFPIDAIDYVPVDSIYYRSLSHFYCHKPFLPFVEAFSESNSIVLNWVTIISLGAFACALSPDSADLIIMFSNLLMFFCVLLVYEKIIKTLEFSVRQKLFFYLFFLLQSYLLISLITLNKEIFNFLFVAVLLLFYMQKKIIPIIAVSLLGGLFKVQLLLFGILLVIILFRIKLRYVILLLSFILPIVSMYGGSSFLDAESYYSRYSYNIRTANIALILNDINNYPLGYVLVMPARLAVNLLSGFSVFRIFSIDNILVFLYQFNAFIISMLSVSLAWKVFFNKLSIHLNLLTYIMAYSIIICIIPFFQLRYFFALFPIMVILLLMNKDQWNKSIEDEK